MPRLAFALVLALAAAAGCGPIVPGGDSGVPDSTVGDWRQPSGEISTGGRIQLYRENNWAIWD
jgi:hypothetical protein